MTQVGMTTTESGPLFDGRARKAVGDFLDEAEREVSQAGVNEVRARLGPVLQNPTGAYASSIVTERAQSDRVVTDGGVIYGPWLEGVSSRNKASRFKGYATFRKTQQWLQGKAAPIAESKIRPFLNRMGGS